MKRLLLATALALVVATPARADYADDLCTVVAGIAEAAARMHQAGVPLSTVLEAGPTVKKYRPLIVEIYASPRYRTEEAQARSIAGWRDQAHVACLQRQTQPH
jgi:hypothetical protein